MSMVMMAPFHHLPLGLILALGGRGWGTAAKKGTVKRSSANGTMARRVSSMARSTSHSLVMARCSVTGISFMLPGPKASLNQSNATARPWLWWVVSRWLV